MTKTFDEMMKILEEKGAISEAEGATLIKDHGPLTDDEKKDLAAAIRMKRALTKEAPAASAGDSGKPADAPTAAPAEEVSMDDYLQALSVLDSEAATAEEKEKAQKIKERFESQ